MGEEIGTGRGRGNGTETETETEIGNENGTGTETETEIGIDHEDQVADLQSENAGEILQSPEIAHIVDGIPGPVSLEDSWAMFKDSRVPNMDTFPHTLQCFSPLHL